MRPPAPEARPARARHRAGTGRHVVTDPSAVERTVPAPRAVSGAEATVGLRAAATGTTGRIAPVAVADRNVETTGAVAPVAAADAVRDPSASGRHSAVRSGRRRAASTTPGRRRSVLGRWLPLGVVVAVAAVAAGVYVVDQVTLPEIDEPSLLAVVPPAPEVPAIAVAPAGDTGGTPETTTAEATTAAPATEEAEESEEAAAPPRRGPSRRTGDAPAGLPWHSGVNGGGPEQIAAWEDFRGRPVDVIHGFAARQTWDEVVSAGWIMGYYADFDGLLVISQPFWPEGEGGSLGECAAGAYDDKWADYGRTLVETGRTDAYTRLAWEFNGTWFQWSATDVDAWVSCWRTVVDAVRSTAPDARFEWNMNAHGSQSCDGNAWNCYPGDDYVDVIGIDPYDHYPASTTAADFDEQCNDRHGLCHVIDQARERGKEVGVSEWGVINSEVGDNPLYIEKMYETFLAGADVMAYETYFYSEAHGTVLGGGSNPESSQAYRALWGG